MYWIASILAIAVHAQSTGWYFASQPTNLSCIKDGLNKASEIGDSHETIWNPTTCGPTCPKIGDFETVPENYDSKIADSPAAWDSACKATVSQLTSVKPADMLFVNNMNLFARAPGQFLRMVQYPANSNCGDTDLPQQILMYPVYDQCTNMGSYFIWSRVISGVLTQLICPDASCDAKCTPVEVAISKAEQCSDIGGSRYKHDKIVQYVSLRIGYVGSNFQAPDPKKPNQPTDDLSWVKPLIIGSIIVVVILVATLIIIRRRRQRVHETYFEEADYKSMISNHAEKLNAKQPESIYPGSSSNGSLSTQYQQFSRPPPSPNSYGGPNVHRSQPSVDAYAGQNSRSPPLGGNQNLRPSTPNISRSNSSVSNQNRPRNHTFLSRNGASDVGPTRNLMPLNYPTRTGASDVGVNLSRSNTTKQERSPPPLIRVKLSSKSTPDIAGRLKPALKKPSAPIQESATNQKRGPVNLNKLKNQK
jgi:hypothetical protein